MNRNRAAVEHLGSGNRNGAIHRGDNANPKPISPTESDKRCHAIGPIKDNTQVQAVAVMVEWWTSTGPSPPAFEKFSAFLPCFRVWC
jgi:hypothetical protein